MADELRARLDRRTGRRILCGRSGCNELLAHLIQLPTNKTEINSPSNIPVKLSDYDTAAGLAPPGHRFLFADSKANADTGGRGYQIAIPSTHKREARADGLFNYVLTQRALAGRSPKNAGLHPKVLANADGGSGLSSHWQAPATSRRSNLVNVLPLFVECPRCRANLSKQQALNRVDEAVLDQHLAIKARRGHGG